MEAALQPVVWASLLLHAPRRSQVSRRIADHQVREPKLIHGQIDAKIRLWSTSPILSAKSEQKGHPTSLATLTTHSGTSLEAINVFKYIYVTFYLCLIQDRFYVYDGLRAASGWLVAATILLL